MKKFLTLVFSILLVFFMSSCKSDLEKNAEMFMDDMVRCHQEGNEIGRKTTAHLTAGRAEAMLQ